MTWGLLSTTADVWRGGSEQEEVKVWGLSGLMTLMTLNER